MNQLNFQPSFINTFAVASLFVALLGFSCKTQANPSAQATEQARNDLTVTNNKGSELQLEVRQMPLAQVLANITQKTHVPIHYSVLPDGLVTATCVGATLKQVLECLLDRKADLIVRYPDNHVQVNTNKLQLAEAWILGSRLDGTAAKNCHTSPSLANDGSLNLSQNPQETEPDRTDELMKMVESKNPEERADGIGQLLAAGREGDPKIKAALEQALTDQDANVRAQAISTLSHREGNVTGMIQEALHDSSPEVRMMAVDSITNDATLLQQAVNDSDETVRSLATLKLEQLTQDNERIK